MKKIMVIMLITGMINIVASYGQPNITEEAAITESKILVVSYSFSGNTQAVAEEIIKRFYTDTITIKAEKYDGAFGKIVAVKDAMSEVTTIDTKPDSADVSGYDLIFLGSSIWWTRPAVPLWSFVEKTTLKI